ncbi:AraC family transcriptional regulator [Candidatus Leptofilum sp.]|uniref:AraC family transcriptional regulator n=1 Tax=Candidatus Leptofilum sp. TaxID=3241576 RepID=UPI003B59A76A
MEKRLAANIIDSDIEGHYTFFPFVEGISTQLHQHDFFEIFLVNEGSIFHHVNGEMILIRSGSLVFIRPDDAHFFRKHENQSCELINLAFLQDAFYATADFLGIAQQKDALLELPLPPLVLLTTAEKSWVAAQLKQWGQLMYRDKGHSRVTLKAFLAQIISNFFITRFEDYVGDVPAWLKALCQQMQHREYLVEGRTALMRLANRTPEYVGRIFKTHLGVTPSQFINDLRLNYATDLLLHTDLAAIEICYEVGFGNLSHFYHLFKRRWNCSPMQFRKMNQRSRVV